MNINRKIMMSGLSIVSALTLLGGTAFAAFTVQAQTTNNTFSATTPGLLVSVNGGSEGTSVAGVNVSGLIPGIASPTQSFTVRNTDTDAGASTATTMQLTPTGANNLSGDDLSITVNCGGGEITGSYTTWITTPQSIGTIAPGATANCTMTATLSSSAPNSAAGKSAVFDATFTGTVGL